MKYRENELLAEQVAVRIDQLSRDAWKYRSVPLARAPQVWKRLWRS